MKTTLKTLIKNATSLPWRQVFIHKNHIIGSTQAGNEIFWLESESGGKKYHATPQTAANAALIVHCVNTHAELVRAIEHIKRYVAATDGKLTEGEKEVLKTAVEALAKAKTICP